MTWFGWLGLAAFVLFGALFFLTVLAAALPGYGSSRGPRGSDFAALGALAAVGFGVMIWGAVA
jgi:hypothetical protein